MKETNGKRFDRRGFLGLAAGGLLTVAGGNMLSGCGGGNAASGPASGIPNLGEADDLAESTSLGLNTNIRTRRGIQSILFLALGDPFVEKICNTLNAAPPRRPIQIELSAAHDTTPGDTKKGWANAVTAIAALRPRGLSLCVDFGHKEVMGKSPQAWGEDLYTNLIQPHGSNVGFILQLANEDKYGAGEYTQLMSEVLEGLKGAAGSEEILRKIAVRRCWKPIPQSFKDKYPYVVTRSEYHFPAAEKVKWDNKSNAISNDGHIVARSTDPDPWAYDGREALGQVSLQNFKDKYGNQTLLLWHPALHLWPFKDNAYRKPGLGERKNPSPAQQKDFLSLLRDFMQ